MKNLTENQARAVLAFLDAFDFIADGAWPEVEGVMKEEFGIGDARCVLAEVREALA